MKILALDTELTPLVTYSWTLWPSAIPITQIISTQSVMCFGARWVGSKSVIFKSTHHDGKDAMLQELHKLLDEADATLTWNGQSFDSKHIRREFFEAGMLPPSPWKEIDLMLTAKRQFKFASNKLDHISQQMGLAGKTKHTGFQMWVDCMAGDTKAWNLMRTYQKQDVNLLIDLYDKFLPWIPNHPNRAIYDGKPDACIQCGKNDRLQRRGPAVTGTGSYQRLQCLHCGKWQRSMARLATSELRPV